MYVRTYVRTYGEAYNICCALCCKAIVFIFFTCPGLCVRISMWNLVSSSVLPEAFTTRSFTPSGLSTPGVCMV